MATTMISKTITRGDDDLIVMPRKEYDRLIASKHVVEFTPSARDKRILSRARKNYQTGNVLTLNELKNKLGFTR